jgi:mono/diheme cytochrome c family protein
MTCAPVPTFFANSTLETYSQGNVPLASSSCIACHGNAVGFQKGASNRQQGKPSLNQSDFTFMLEKAQ